MNLRALVVVFVPMLAAATLLFAKPPVLRVATEGTFRPFNYLEDGVLKGFEVDLVNALAKKLGRKAEWSTHPFEKLLDGLAAHEYDLVAASHAITPERARVVEFIAPHYCSSALIVTHKGREGSLKALVDKTMGVSAGTTYSERLGAMSRFKEVKIYRDDAAVVAALSKGEVDAWVTDRTVAHTLLKTPAAHDLVPGDQLFPEMIAMAVAKGDPQLKAKINEALAALVKDHTYSKLSERYFGRDISCREGAGAKPGGSSLGN